jgi:predicted nucleic acid-binding protein
MAIVVADTNIVSEILRGNARLDAEFDVHSPYVNTVIYLEMIQGQKSRIEVRKAEDFLQNGFGLFYLDADTQDRAIELVRMYGSSHNLQLPDALIAATCLIEDAFLATYNVRHFRYIPKLKMLRLTTRGKPNSAVTNRQVAIHFQAVTVRSISNRLFISS